MTPPSRPVALRLKQLEPKLENGVLTVTPSTVKDLMATTASGSPFTSERLDAETVAAREAPRSVARTVALEKPKPQLADSDADTMR
jgi:hypothetical protein